ncbi:MAG TPA: UDP-N-acetylmuramoyl-tripeptide--D-alanyl-D-alanine ligase [Puia sp.]|nr:UDP-N-acetylmuramoyl-tripeptide--D-alanyl-D-alanine ligase [Puia sp.]
MNIGQLYQLFLQHPSIQTDTRRLKKGDLFFALKGPSFNGNLFAMQALEQGAAYSIIDESPGASTQHGLPAKAPFPDDRHDPSGDQPGPSDSRLILVNDVLQTLQDLAMHHRMQFNIPFIAITGSNGKTTTKELIHAVLSSAYRTYTTQGNLNNHIGVPLTILSIKADAQFAVIEMGANHLHEIAGYCAYTRPTHGIITNVGKAHLEGFGGPEGVKKGKGELYDFLRSGDVPAVSVPTASGGTAVSGSTAFVMWDYDYLRDMSLGIPHIVTYGTHDADYTGDIRRSNADAYLHVGITRGAATGAIQTQLIGDYNLPNVLVAVAVGKHFGVTDDNIRRAIGQYTPSNSRSQLIERDGNHIILDAYNANPSSMRAAIENFARIQGTPSPAASSSKVSSADTASSAAGSTSHATSSPTGSVPAKVLVLGAMAELGAESLEEHRGIVSLIGQYPWQQVLLVGGDFLRVQHPWLSFENARQAGEWLKDAGLKGAYILIKGSRSMKMEEVL